jgi:hypothetical protein
MSVAVGGCGNTSEYDVFLCVCIVARGLCGVAQGDVFAWAYAVIICSQSEFFQICRVKAVSEGEVEDGGCDEVVSPLECRSDGGWGFILVRGGASTVGGFV